MDPKNVHHTYACRQGHMRAEQPSENGFVARRAYIGGMPFWYTEEQIREVWESCGSIEALTLLTFPDTGNFRGIAFVTFKDQEGYESALAYDGDELDGKTLVVKPCLAPSTQGPPSEQHRSADGQQAKARHRTQEAAAGGDAQASGSGMCCKGTTMCCKGTIMFVAFPWCRLLLVSSLRNICEL